MPKFEVFEDGAGKFRFRLVGANGEIMAQSEAYANKFNAWRGVADLKRAVMVIVRDDAEREREAK